jgi:L-lactate dehydrogenase complex protein LldE
MEVDIFIPCFIDQVSPQTGISMVKILKKAGAKVFYNPKQTCCGQMALNGGFFDEAKAVAQKFINDFNNTRYVVGPSASCVGMVRNHYPILFDNSAYHLEARGLTKRIFEFTDFLVNVMKIKDLKSEFIAKATIHDSCSALREYKLGNEPRILLSKVKGLEIVEMEHSDVCCGFGGTFSVKHEAISTAMAQQKVDNAMKTGAEYIISTEGSCLMHIQSYIDKNNLPIKTIHIADVLANNL